MLSSCHEKKNNLSFYDIDNLKTDSVNDSSRDVNDTLKDSVLSSNIISIPFSEEDGVKLIDVRINATIGLKMIIDSGCSGALISIDEANYLYNKGVLTSDDIKGITQSQIADGSIVENMVVNLREVTIGDKIVCTNVKATVSSNSGAPLLLGNEILNRTASYTVDNENKVINFILK